MRFCRAWVSAGSLWAWVIPFKISFMELQTCRMEHKKTKSLRWTTTPLIRSSSTLSLRPPNFVGNVACCHWLSVSSKFAIMGLQNRRNFGKLKHCCMRWREICLWGGCLNGGKGLIKPKPPTFVRFHSSFSESGPIRGTAASEQ